MFPSPALEELFQNKTTIYKHNHNLTPDYQIWQLCATGGNGMCRDCIACAVYPNRQVTIDNASELMVREKYIKAIPQSVKLILLLGNSYAF